MNFRKVGNLVAFDLGSVTDRYDSKNGILAALEDLGLRPIKDESGAPRNPKEILKEKARWCLKNSVFCRGATMDRAPEEVDCSGLIKWLYGQIGIWIPRRSGLQWPFGTPSVGCTAEFKTGDLLFKKGKVNFRSDKYAPEIGHVAMVLEPGLEGTVIHATRRLTKSREKKPVVTKTRIKKFISSKNYQGSGWIAAFFETLIVVEIPPDSEKLEIETGDDIKYLLLTKSK